MQTVTVDPAGEVDAVARIGASLRAEIARRAIAIEINPTSNLLVGDLSDLAGHPLWRLAPPRPNPDLPPLSVTVGSDDPETLRPPDRRRRPQRAAGCAVVRTPAV